MKNKIFSFDAETDGLWGPVFAVAAICYEFKSIMSPASWNSHLPGTGLPIPEGWVITDKILLRLPDDVVTSEWVKENVLPELIDTPVTHTTQIAMLRDFAEFYLKNKVDADVIVHMGCPVETTLLRNLYDAGLIGEWDGPYPLIDLAGCLAAVGEDPTSVDSYAKTHNLKIISEFGSTHNPLYDCEVTVKVYIDIMSK